MKVTYHKPGKQLPEADAYLFLFFEDESLFKAEIKNIEALLNVNLQNLKPEDFSGKENNVELIITNDKRIILSGIGTKEKSTLEKVRRATAKGIAKLKDYNVKKVAVKHLDGSITGASAEDIAIAQCEACVLALYKFDRYKIREKEKNKNKIRISELIFFSSSYNSSLVNALETGRILGEATCVARDVGNEPSNIATPEFMADFISQRGKKLGYKVKVWGPKDIIKMGMGCMYGVAKGSANEPRFVEMRYDGGSSKQKPVVFVGKGVTFDSGGISIKPAGGMEDMKMDMGGSAAVIGAFEAVAQLKLKVNLIGLIPFVENMPDGNSYKPGDILTASNGMTVEIINTDAEGRLVLADALAYAARFNPEFVIDLATLTGAAVIALGHTASIIMSNDEALTNKVKKAGEDVYEKVWELPSWEEYDKLIDSDIADVVHTGPPREAGTIIGGMFLKRFVDGYKWLHIDIAGTAISNKATDYVPKHATGVGVRLLTRLLLSEYK